MTAATKTSPATKNGRIEWVDCAKGLSIMGVCLMHVVTGVPGGPDTWLGKFSALLDPVRMPLFFLLSGLFAHRVVERSFSDLWFRRLWFLLIPYLVFSPAQAAIRLDMADDLSVWTMIRSIIVGDPGMWFLYALMAYNIVAWLLRNVNPNVAILLSTIPLFVAIWAGQVDQQWPRNLVQYLPIFMIGLHYRQFFFGLARKAFRPLTILWVVGLYAAFEFTYRYLHATVFAEWNSDVAAQSTFFHLFRNIGVLPIGVLLGVWLLHIPVVTRIFGAVGRHTLPVYCSHHIMLHVVTAMIIPGLIVLGVVSEGYNDMVDLRITVGLLTCVAAGVGFYWIGRVPKLGWILYPPPLPRRAQNKEG